MIASCFIYAGRSVPTLLGSGLYHILNKWTPYQQCFNKPFLALSSLEVVQSLPAGNHILLTDILMACCPVQVFLVQNPCFLLCELMYSMILLYTSHFCSPIPSFVRRLQKLRNWVLILICSATRVCESVCRYKYIYKYIYMCTYNINMCCLSFKYSPRIKNAVKSWFRQFLKHCFEPRASTTGCIIHSSPVCGWNRLTTTAMWGGFVIFLKNTTEDVEDSVSLSLQPKQFSKPCWGSCGSASWGAYYIMCSWQSG